MSDVPVSAGGPRASTGIDGLDAILGGGLTKERVYLVEGTPGTGKTTLSSSSSLMGGATARLLSEFDPLAQRAVGDAISLAFDLDPATHPIRIDPAQLEAAVLNLIVNARDAMPEGGTITVQARNVRCEASEGADFALAPGDYAMIAVKDTGTGMEAPTLARFLSRSSRPRRSARVPASGWHRFTDFAAAPEATCRSSRRQVGAPPSRS